jgi:uncharacterized protein YbaP (TraB family)
MTPRALAGRLAVALSLLCGLSSPGAVLARQPDAACPPSAGPPTAEQTQAGLRSARDRGFLWRLQKDGRSSWLYGTLHVARLEWVFPGPLLTRALRQADTIALELDMLDPQIRERLLTPPADARPVALPQALSERLARQIERACLPEQAIAALPPALQAATLMVMSGRWDGLDPAYGIDPMLAGFGHAAGKRVVSLETPELQARALLGRSAAEHLQFVEQTLAELETGRARPALLRIADVWARGDLAEMERYEQWCGCMETEAERAQMRRLLDDRNIGLAEGIDRLHGEGASVLAGVGSLHMIGRNGLPALMAQRGYRVERVPFEPAQRADAQ